MIGQQRQAYREEAAELLDELETALLALEESPADRDLVDRAFRSLHTIKGSGAMFDFTTISAFAHEVETAFDAVRDGRLAVTGELVSIGLAAHDHLSRLLAEDETESETLLRAGQDLIGRLHQITGGIAAASDGPASEQLPDDAGAATYRIRFRPTRQCFLNGTNPLPLLDELRALGQLSLVADTEAIPPLEQMDPECCYIGWDMLLTTAADENTLRDVFIFVEEDADLEIERLPGDPLREDEQRELDQLLAAAGSSGAEETLAAFLAGRSKPAEQPAPADTVGQEDPRRPSSAGTVSDSGATVRVAAEKLDALVNVVGEIVTLRARVGDYAQTVSDPVITSIAEEMERLTERLRDDTMSMRMLPVGTAFSRLKRLVRDLSRDLGKEVVLETEGEETELDKTVIERLGDPLLHLVRNSIDHGIEPPAERRAGNKPEYGAIRLTACHEGGSVVITVADDGAGLNRNAILNRAEEAGLVESRTSLSDSEIDALILQPGFSTATQVTKVSGRGVGMDVVKRTIDELRGTLEVTSRPGKGTSFRMKLPLTLAIIDGLLVEVAGHGFVLPMANIVECMELAGESRRGNSCDLITVRGEMVGCMRLRQHFDLGGSAPPIEQAVVAETRYGKMGFIVDRVIGDHQTVIKTLGTLYRNVEVVSGATILGDGTVALILDAEKLAADVVKSAA